MIYVSSFSIGTLCAYCVYRIAPPLPRLSERIHPYDTVVRVRLGRSIHTFTQKNASRFFIIEYLRPIFDALLRITQRFFINVKPDVLTLRLEHAGIPSNVEKYQIDLAKKMASGLGIGVILGAGIGNVPSIVFFSLLLGFSSLAKSRGALEKKIKTRQESIRSEMYTINQLLALHIRTGSGTTQAISRVVDRTHGIVSDELRDVLHRVHAGSAIEDSLMIAAQKTPEPHAARTYKLLAAASLRGVDLTDGLLDLSHDLRRSIRDDVKAAGTRKRAAMLIPTIGILAPIMLLFVAAPIPTIVLGGQ